MRWPSCIFVDPQLPPHHWPQDWTGTDVCFVYGDLPTGRILHPHSPRRCYIGGEWARPPEVIGGQAPLLPVHTGDYGPLIERLSASPAADERLLPHDDLWSVYTHAHVAIDMIMPNAERELAFQRPIHYMWCGLG